MAIEQLVTTSETQETVEFDWGTIVWADSKELTGEDTLTVGKVTIEAGERNSEHYHPNCDETLYLLSGVLTHTLGDEEIVLEPGDLIHIPEGEPHQGINEGDEDAVAIICYDTGSREFTLVDEDADSE